MRQNATNELPLILDKDELAATLKVTPRTIERWIRDGLFPHGRRVGGQVRWLRDDLLRALGVDEKPS